MLQAQTPQYSRKGVKNEVNNKRNIYNITFMHSSMSSFWSYFLRLYTNKVVPSTVEAYKTSNTIKDEISQEIVDYPKQNITREITDSDLTIKKQDKSYESGKANPFSNTTSSASGNTTENTTTPSGNNNTNKNPDSTDHYFNNISGK